jgi:putative transposase
MNRKRTRYLDETTWHHVYNRGADGQDIFSLDGDQSLFENLIGETVAVYDVEIHAYALMSNHFHFLIRDSNRELSEFMQFLAGQYAAAYNIRTQRRGPLFEGRFGSVPILDEHHLIIEARYVERNPLAFVPSSLLAAYAHSSLGVYIGKRQGPAWLSTDEISPRVSGVDYLDFVLADHTSDTEQRSALPPVRQISAAQIEATVGELIPNDIRTARLLSIVVAVERRAASTAELAEHHRVSPAGIRQIARRARVRRDTDPVFQRLHASVHQAIRQAS